MSNLYFVDQLLDVVAKELWGEEFGQVAGLHVPHGYLQRS